MFSIFIFVIIGVH